MNKTMPEVEVFTKQFKGFVVKPNMQIGIAAPFIYLHYLQQHLATDIAVCAEDCSQYSKTGAYTGDVSASLLQSINITYVIVGHSERRNIFQDSNEMVNSKLKNVLNANLKAILCVGESQEIFKNDATFQFINHQLETCLAGISEEKLQNIIIAYEPIWAIGTGATATPAIAQKVIARIRSWFVHNYSSAAAQNIIIQYGGSVKPDNADGLMKQPDIDGLLIGGASLDPQTFVNIINNIS